MVTKCERCGYDLEGLATVNDAKFCPECGHWTWPRMPLSGARTPERRAILIGCVPSISIIAIFFVVGLFNPRTTGAMESLANGLIGSFFLTTALCPFVALALYLRRSPRRWKFGIPVVLLSYGAIVAVLIPFFFFALMLGAGTVMPY